MNRIATALCSLVLAVLLGSSAFAQQEVTVREINELDDADLQFLIDNAETLTRTQIEERILSPLDGQSVQFTAVLLSDPYRSGERTPDTTPINTLYYVRDTSAVSQGVEGMGILISDEVGEYNEFSLRVGDVYTFQGEVVEFASTTQIALTSIVETLGPYQALGLPDFIVEPVTITTSDANAVVLPETSAPLQLNWANYESLVGQYVRIEGAQVVDRVQDDDFRPGFLVSSPGEESAIGNRDLSLRYRNDRFSSEYASNPDFESFVRDPNTDPFVPPQTGRVVNLQGFLVLNFFDLFDVSTPDGAVFRISPWTDADLEVLEEGPPVITSVGTPEGVIGNEPFEVTVEAEGANRTITSVTLDYEFSSGDSGEITLTESGTGVYTGTIPAAPDGDFVTYSATATDNEGDSTTSDDVTYRVLYDGITEIAQIQTTANGAAGDSPFAGLENAEMNIEAVVMSDPETSGFLTLQDDEGLAPWTGIYVDLTLDIAELQLEPGDRVTVTSASIVENFDVTRLDDATLTVTGSGEPYAYKVVPTGTVAETAAAEAHEGMALRFENVAILDVNADGDDSESGFGEWQFTSDGTSESEVRGDDASDAIPSDFNVTTFNRWDRAEFIQGLWYYSFGNYKLLPESPDDIGALTVDAEDGAQASAFGLDRAYPNPFHRTATLRFDLDAAGPVTMKVYDVVGREVATLVDAELGAQRHTVTLDGRGLAGGVYFVRLVAGDRTSTQKVVLVK
jgi:hypothetical protein